MSRELWTNTDKYIEQLLFKDDPLTANVFSANQKAGLPAIDVSPAQGYFLNLLVSISGAKRILEIGTLGGYSAIHFARALPEGGSVVSLEVNERHAQVARANIVQAGQENKIEVLVGNAIDTLATLKVPFDLVFIDADKPSMPVYLDYALKLSKPGTIIIGDNVVRDGKVSGPATDNNVKGAQEFLQLIAANPNLTATVLQTVGSKGYDGFAIARVDKI